MSGQPGAGDPIAPGSEAGLAAIPEQTPLFWALNKDRYLRQSWIRDIQAATNRKLIIYVANFGHPQSAISHDDVPPFPDLLADIDPETDLDLLLHSPGGDIDAAERLVYMCRKRSRSFRVLVPSSAKSAATLIAIAADSIVMGYVSELGPIDPQVYVNGPGGEPMWRPAQSFLDGLQTIKEETTSTGTLSPVYYPLLDKLDPALLDFCQKAIDRSKSFARKWLERGMCAGDPTTAQSIAERLCDVEKYLSHSAVIDAEEATEMGLRVEHLGADDDLWQRVWRLYSMYEVATRGVGNAKIYESERASIIL